MLKWLYKVIKTGDIKLTCELYYNNYLYLSIRISGTEYCLVYKLRPGNTILYSIMKGLLGGGPVWILVRVTSVFAGEEGPGWQSRPRRPGRYERTVEWQGRRKG